MLKEEKEKFRQMVEDKIEKLNSHITELEELTQPIAPENAIGRVSRMDAINNRSVNEAALRQARNKLNGLNHVLQNMDTANFGKCVRCGNDIPMGRLLLVPESGKCIRCS
ncbi:MAG: TraR/DksA C4-type zinc finger protein [Bacteroidales bacterium]|nr:TraR/DksA C4-type zinc finger protein [Bacteroidales bacterium]